MPMALRHTTPPQEREAGTRPQALVLGRGVPRRRYRVPMASCGVLGRRYRVPMAFCDVPARRYGVPMASYDVLARRYGVPTVLCSVLALRCRPWMTPHAVRPAGYGVSARSSARSRVPASRSGGEIGYSLKPGARFTPGSSGSVRHPLPGRRQNEKRVPDSGRARIASLVRGRRRRLELI